MKNVSILFALMLGIFTFAQCPTGNVTLTSQAQVNAFGANYPSCDEINGNLTISGNFILDLSPLSNITNVTGNVNLQGNEELQNLNGLSNLTHIGGSLLMSTSNTLTSLSGLDNLTSVGKYIQFNGNENLENLNGLEQLTSINGYLYILNNPSLTNIDGVSNINPATVNSSFAAYKDLQIVNNPQLSTCAISSVCSLLDLDTTNARIQDNGPDCNSIEEVIEACANVTPVCPLPTNVTSSVSGRQITVNYTVPQGMKIDVKAGTSPAQLQNIRDNRIEFRNITANPFTTPNLTANQDYFWRMRTDCSGDGVDNSYVSEWSEVYTATTGSNAGRNTASAKSTETSLFPNPATNMVKISGFNAVKADIYNTQGVMLKSVDVTDNTVQLNGLPTGNYTIQLTDVNGKTETKQLMKK